MARIRIFVGGVHGAGKGLLCSQLVTRFMSEYVSVSKLLKWESRLKLVKDVYRNQMILKELLESSTRNDSSYIIDGHFALWNDNYECEIVPLELFLLLKLSAIIITTCESETIQKRIKQRDGILYNLGDIKKLQSLEIKQAKFVADSLAIPLIIVDTTKNINFNNIFKYIETMKTYTRENILSQMLKTVVIRIDFTGLTSLRSFVNRIKSYERMKQSFERMAPIHKQDMSPSFKPNNIEDGQLPLTESQKSTLYRFYDCKMGGSSKATLDLEPCSITLAIDCQENYKGSNDYSYFMGWLIDELQSHDQYVVINRLGVRKIDAQVLEPGETINRYFNERYIVAQSWNNSPQKTKSILTELLEIDDICFNVVQYIDCIGDDRRVRLIYDVDAFLNGEPLEKALKSGNTSKVVYHDMQDRMFDLFVSVASESYLESCKRQKA